MILPRYTDQKWRVSHNEDTAADIVNTRSLDFSKNKYISLKQKPVVLYTNADDSNLAIPLAICGSESLYYIVTSDGIYTTSDGITFIELTTSSRPNIYFGTDAVIYKSALAVTGTTTAGYYDGSWHSYLTGLNSNPHPVCQFENRQTLCTADGNTVYQTTAATWTDDSTTDGSSVYLHRLTLPIEYIVTGMRWRQNNLYIFTRNVSGGNAMMFVWNGSGNNAQYGFPVNADWIYSGANYDNATVIMTSAAQLLRFNGGGFDELENLPVYSTPYSWSSNASIANGIGKVANRGMIAKGKSLFINLDGSVTVANSIGYPNIYMPNQPSGLWEYAPVKGLSHMAGYCYSKYTSITLNGVNSSDLDCGTTAHGCETGDPIYFKTVTGLSGVTNGQTYYCIKTSTTSMMLALTPADAANGKNLSITGTASSCVIFVETLDSIGATLLPGGSSIGAIGLFNTIIFNAFLGTKLMFGGAVTKANGVTGYALMSLGLGRNRGWFVTLAMGATAITDFFKHFYIGLKYLTQTADSIHVKFRRTQMLEYPSVRSSITWTSASVFTITPNTSSDFASIAVGDEVNIIAGAGAGYAAHVATIAQSGSVYTVTLDEAIPLIVNGNVSTIYVENWTNLESITSTSPNLGDGFGDMEVGQNGSWISFKVEMRGTYVATDRVIVSTSPQREPL